MTTRTVTTQAELEAAQADPIVDLILIDSPRGVWLTVEASGSATVEAYGSATVEAYGSATVRASGSATVEASGSATVRASGSATVEAYGSATVRASGSATVEAYGSATVEASGSATVRAYGSATVRAGKYVAVYLHSQAVTLTGGVVIDMTALDRSDPQTWCDLNGVDVSDGRATVYKGVNAELRSEHGATYPIGETVTAPDWQPTRACGAGLHFSPTPLATHDYCTPQRYLECTVDLASMIVLDDKVKAQSVYVVREVDRFARPIAAEAVSS